MEDKETITIAIYKLDWDYLNENMKRGETFRDQIYKLIKEKQNEKIH